MTVETGLRSPLHGDGQTTPTDYRNDSCSIEELTYAIENGAVGATSNPTIVGEVLRRRWTRGAPGSLELAAANATATEDEVTWALIEEMAVNAATLLLPVFDARMGERDGCRSRRARSSTATRRASREQRIRFDGSPPNIQVKSRDARGHRRDRGTDRTRASTSTRRCDSPCRRRSRSGQRSSGGSTPRVGGRRDLRRWPPSARSWSAGSTTGSRSLLSMTGAPADAWGMSTGRASPASSARTRSTASAATARAVARGRIPEPPALVGARGRRHRADDPREVAATLQRVRHRGDSAVRRSRAGRRDRGARAAVPTSSAPTSRMG